MNTNVKILPGTDPAGVFLQKFDLHEVIFFLHQTRFAINFLQENFVGGSLRKGLTQSELLVVYQQAIRAKESQLSGHQTLQKLEVDLRMSNASNKLKQDSTRYAYIVVRSARDLISDEITRHLESENLQRKTLLKKLETFYDGHQLEWTRPHDRRHIMSQKALESRFIGELLALIITTYALYGDDVNSTIDRLNECHGLVEASFANALTVPLHTHIAFSDCASVCYAGEFEANRRGLLFCENVANRSTLVVDEKESAHLVKDLSLLVDKIDEMQKGYIQTHNRDRGFTHYIDDYSYDGGRIRFTALCSFFKKLAFEESSNTYIGKLTLFRRPKHFY